MQCVAAKCWGRKLSKLEIFLKIFVYVELGFYDFYSLWQQNAGVENLRNWRFFLNVFVYAELQVCDFYWFWYQNAGVEKFRNWRLFSMLFSTQNWHFAVFKVCGRKIMTSKSFEIEDFSQYFSLCVIVILWFLWFVVAKYCYRKLPKLKIFVNVFGYIELVICNLCHMNPNIILLGSR